MGYANSNSWTKAFTSLNESWFVRSTPSMITPESLYCSYDFSSAGVSARQGGHHVAQKLTTTILPRNSERVTLFPSSVSRVKSGARKPWRGLGEEERGAPTADGTREATIHRNPNARLTSIKVSQRFFRDELSDSVISDFSNPMTLFQKRINGLLKNLERLSADNRLTIDQKCRCTANSDGRSQTAFILNQLSIFS
jgi:hypothetical protein